MDYSKILSRAWNIVWTNKWLLVLGFFAALGSGGGTSNNFSSTYSNPDSFGTNTLPSNFQEIMAQITPYLGYIIAFACFFIFLGIALWLLRLVSEAGLIASVDRLEGGEKLSLRDGFQAGGSHLKSMIGLSLVLYGPLVITGFIIMAIASSVIFRHLLSAEEFSGSTLGLVAACIVPLSCLIALASLVLSLVYPMAQRGIIIEGFGVMDGIRRGWHILRQNIGEILLLGLMFLVIGFLVGIVALIITLPIALVSLLPVFFTAMDGGDIFTTRTLLLAVGSGILFVLLSAVVNSIVRALQSTAFTLAYHRWAGLEAKLPIE